MTLAGLIAQAYPSPEWAVFYEVSNTTGFGANRRADAIALGIWPSRGNTIVGFEFKEDRRDWLKEKQNPAKAEAIAAKCDCWWLVAGRDGIVKPDELPEPWGLYVANEDRTKLRVAKPCVPFVDRDKAVMQRSFAAAMLRKVTETMVPKAELQRLVDERAKQIADASTSGREAAMLQRRLDEIEQAVAAFEEASGVTIRGWRGPGKIGKAVEAVLDMGGDRRRLENARDALRASSRSIDEALAAWPVPAEAKSA